MHFYIIVCKHMFEQINISYLILSYLTLSNFTVKKNSNILPVNYYLILIIIYLQVIK